MSFPRPISGLVTAALPYSPTEADARISQDPTFEANKPLFTNEQKAKIDAALEGVDLEPGFPPFENLCFHDPNLAIELMDKEPRILEPREESQYHLLENLSFAASCGAYPDAYKNIRTVMRHILQKPEAISTIYSKNRTVDQLLTANYQGTHESFLEEEEEEEEGIRTPNDPQFSSEMPAEAEREELQAMGGDGMLRSLGRFVARHPALTSAVVVATSFVANSFLRSSEPQSDRLS